MPQVKGMHLGKWKAQEPIEPTQVVMKKVRRQTGYGMGVHKVERYFDFELAWSSHSGTTEKDVDILRSYRRGLAQCVEGSCECACNCHSGGYCPREENDETVWVHTPGHKLQYVLIKRDQNDKDCPWEGTNHHHKVVCHESTKVTKWHKRIANTVHKGSHRECPKGDTHKR